MSNRRSSDVRIVQSGSDGSSAVTPLSRQTESPRREDYAAVLRARCERGGISGGCIERDCRMEITDRGDGRIRASIDGVIDTYWGFSIDQFRSDLAPLRGSIREMIVEINSPGGAAVDGIALHSTIRQIADEGATIRTEAVGLVASAAVAAYAAGDERYARPASMLMVHQPWAMILAAGTADELRAAAERVAAAMEKIQESYLETMPDSVSAETAAGWMDGEDHWMLAGEAQDAGLVTVVRGADSDEEDEEAEMRAALDISADRAIMRIRGRAAAAAAIRQEVLNA